MMLVSYHTYYLRHLTIDPSLHYSSYQIELGGKGQYTEGRDATRNWDKDGVESGGKVTFEDIDGFEVLEDNGKLYAVLQEDSGSKLGERAFISSELEHEADGEDLKYYFIASSGGDDNSP